MNQCIHICFNTVVPSEQSSTLQSPTLVQSTTEGMFVRVHKQIPMTFNQTQTHTCTHTATLTPGELSNFILPMIIVSATLNILLIAAVIVLIIIVISTARKKSGKVWCRFILY